VKKVAENRNYEYLYVNYGIITMYEIVQFYGIEGRKVASMATKNFAKGEIIFKEGANGDSFFDVLKGTVGIFINYGEADEQKLTEVKEGGILGEMALIDAFPRSATAVALEDVEADEVSVDQVKEYFNSNPNKIERILNVLCQTLARLTNDYVEVCDTIKNLYPESGERKESLADKIKKFATYYKRFNKNNQPSAEFLRETGQSGHKNGYAKKVESYSEGTVIFREGEAGRCMYDIHAGSVGIYTGYGKPEEKLLTKLHVDTFFGELGMLEDMPRTATAVALEDGTTVESIYSSEFAELFEKNPAKIEMILRHLSFRIRRLTGEYENACKIISDVADAEASDANVSDEMRQKAREFKSKLYD